MTFHPEDRHSPLWKALKAEMDNLIEDRRTRLEKITDTALIAKAQGQIAAYRQIIALVEPEDEPKVQPTEPEFPKGLY